MAGLRALGVPEALLLLHVIGPNMNHQPSIAAHRESKFVRLHGRVRGEELDKLMRRSMLTYAHLC
jgi:hypothetical protein